MDLKKRLAQLDKLTRKPDSTAESTSRSDQSAIRPDRETVLTELGLQRFETAAGPVWYVDHCENLLPPADPIPELTGLFVREPARRPRISEVLFLDTETTGLAGGTGTLVFQLGLSWWRADVFHTRQYFLPGPADEAALLAALAEIANDFAVVVTFNGASFDLPLLRTRALLNRLPDPLRDLVSWDLLVPSRRLWANRLPNCRQQTLEQFVCGRERNLGDIDGAQIPQTWFDFLANGQAGLLSNVLTHNHRDMVGMGEIFQRICRVGLWLGATAGRADQWAAHGLPDDRAGAWVLGRVCERRMAVSEAAACFRRAWERPWAAVSESDSQRRFRRDAIRNLKRCEQWELVEEVIHDGLLSDANDTALHREAAILYEHRRVDLDRALHHALRAADEHRTARLERLLLKRAG